MLTISYFINALKTLDLIGVLLLYELYIENESLYLIHYNSVY